VAEISRLFVSIGSKFDDTGMKASIKAIDDFNKKTVDIQKGIQTAGLALTGFAIAGVAGLTKILGSAIESEKATSRLASAMKQAGTYTDEAFKHAKEFATAMQLVSTADDEAIISVQKSLTNFGIQGEMLDKLTKATLDFASAKGIDLVSAGDLLAKTVGGETNALSRYGIVIEGSAGSTKRMQSAVEGITKLFGGSAQAEAETFSGRIQILKNRFEDLLETFGTYLFPAFDKLLGYADSIIKTFEKMPPELQQLIVNFTLWGSLIAGSAGVVLLFISNITKMISSLVQLVGGIKAVNAVMSTAGFIGLAVAVTTAILAIVDALDAWIDRSNRIAGERAKELDTIKGAIAQYKAENEAIIKRNQSSKLSEEEHKKNEIAYQKNINAIDKLNLKLKEEEKIRIQTSKTKEKLTDKEIKQQDELMRNQLEMHKIQLRDYRDYLERQISMVEEGSIRRMELERQLYDVLKLLHEEQRFTLLGGWALYFEELNKQQTNWADIFKSVFDDATASISTGLVNIYNDTQKTFDSIAKITYAVWDSIKQILVKKVADMVAGAIVEMITLGKATKALAIVDLAINSAIAIGRVLAGWASIPFVGWAIGLGFVAGIAHEFDQLQGGIRGLAQGGLVMTPGLAMIAESGSPEVVLPLNSPATSQMLGDAISKSETNIGGNNININVSYDAISDRHKAREMADILGNEMFKKIKQNRKV